jgi:putative ABC transport system permease protein
MIAAAAILAGAARLLTRVVARVARERVRVAFRHGLSALARPGAGTLPAVTALGLGVLVVVAIALVHLGVMSKLRADLPRNAPNVFLVDLQSNQWPGVRAILEAAGATEIRGVPIVNARLLSIDGVLATDLAKKGPDEGRRKWILTREQNLTYLDELPKDNVVVEGKLWSDPEHPEISIERDFDQDLTVAIHFQKPRLGPGFRQQKRVLVNRLHGIHFGLRSLVREGLFAVARYLDNRSAGIVLALRQSE